MENKRITEPTKHKICLLKELTKMNKFLAKGPREKNRQITYKRGDIISDLAEIKRS